MTDHRTRISASWRKNSSLRTKSVEWDTRLDDFHYELYDLGFILMFRATEADAKALQLGQVKLNNTVVKTVEFNAGKFGVFQAQKVFRLERNSFGRGMFFSLFSLFLKNKEEWNTLREWSMTRNVELNYNVNFNLNIWKRRRCELGREEWQGQLITETIERTLRITSSDIQTLC